MNTNLLIHKLRDRDQKAFKKIFDRYYSNMVSYSYRYTFDRSTSEDIVQEVFIQLWENAERINIKTSLSGYLFTMVRNKCLNHLRSIDVSDKEQLLDISAALCNEIAMETIQEEDEEIWNQKAQVMLESLPEKMREIFKLKVVSGYSYLEIAQELNVSINTVKTQLKRARIKLGELAIYISFLLFSI